MAKKILIPQVNRYASIVLIKMLRMLERDVFIVGCDPSPFGFSSGSILVDHFVQSPPLVEQATDRAFLLSLCEQESIDLVLPFMEQELLMIASEPNHFPLAPVSGYDTLSLFLHKLNATRAVQELGVSVPRVINDLFQAPSDVVVRKNYGAGSEGIYYINLDEDEQILNWFRADAFAQERIFGDEYTVDVFADSLGNPKIMLPRKRIQIRNGVSIVCQVEQQDDVLGACKKIYSQYAFPGFSCAQFIVSEGKPFFIELNPRIAATAIAGVLASFNYMELLFQELFDGRTLEPMEYYMGQTAWNSIVSRYYEEAVSISGKS